MYSNIVTTSCTFKLYLRLFSILSLFRLLEKCNALRLPFSPSSLSPQIFWDIGEFGAEKYFTDHQSPDTIQLFIAIKGNISSLFYCSSEQVAVKENTPETT